MDAGSECLGCVNGTSAMIQITNRSVEKWMVHIGRTRWASVKSMPRGAAIQRSNRQFNTRRITPTIKIVGIQANRDGETLIFPTNVGKKSPQQAQLITATAVVANIVTDNWSLACQAR